MAQRIRHRDVGEHLGAAGHSSSEFEGGNWDPGYRTAQSGPRRVHVYHDGPGEEQQIHAYATTLQNLGYTVDHQQQTGGGRRRLVITRP